MSSKKGKSNKGKTMSLQEFNAQIEDHGQSPAAGQNVIYAPKKPTNMGSSWADEVEEEELITERERIILPSAPRASRGPAIDERTIPREGPFNAHLGNLSYDIGEDDVAKFFRDLAIAEMRLPKDGQTNRLRGFGYVEFRDRESLISALSMNESMLKGRPVRISLGQPGQNTGSRNDHRQPDETPDDWRSAMDGPMASRGGGGFPPRDDDFGRQPMGRRPYDDYGGGGGRDRGGDRYGEDRGRDRGFGGGGFGGDRERFGGERDRFGGDRGRSFGGGGGPEESFDAPWRDERMAMSRPQYPPPRERMPVRERYDEEPQRERPRGPPPRSSSPTPSKESSSSEPRERKRLVLAPRTVPDPVGANIPAATSSIFGGAKPVDTAAREREIEEKLATGAQNNQIRILQRPHGERGDSNPRRSESEGDELREETTEKDSHSEPEDERDAHKFVEEREENEKRSEGPKGARRIVSPRRSEDRRDVREHPNTRRPDPRDGQRDQRSSRPVKVAGPGKPKEPTQDKDGFTDIRSGVPTRILQEEKVAIVPAKNKFECLVGDDENVSEVSD